MFIIDIYYFDQSGKGFSIPYGVQDYFEDKKYIFRISTFIPDTNLTYDVSYLVKINKPSDTQPVVLLQ